MFQEDSAGSALTFTHELNDETEFYEDEDGEGPFESLLRHASEIEAGLVPGWKLDRSHPGALLWTTPSGRHYKSTLDGSSYVLH